MRASWTDGPARAAIESFIAEVTDAGGPGYIPPSDRVAVFDNDGTLWCERPAYVQVFFILDRLAEQVAAAPEFGDDPVVRALLGGDLEAALASGLGPVVNVLLAAHAGLTVEEFTAAVETWRTTFRHPDLGVPVTALVYRPMLRLIELLQKNAFDVFVVTGGGVDFLRALSDELYGIPPARVVGSAVEVRFERDAQGITLLRTAALSGSPNEGRPKVINIHRNIGRRPQLAAGNSAGDREMLEYVSDNTGPSLCLVIDHDDAEREYAYAGASVTDPTTEPITQAAQRRGWTVVSIRRDWARVFA